MLYNQLFMALSSLSDAELWNLILDDDCRAFSVLFQRHWLILYKTANKYLQDEQASEEVIHDLFLNIWNRKKNLVINDFNKYFKAAIRYQVYSYRKKYMETPVIYLETLNDHNGYQTAHADTELTYRELKSRLYQHLNALPFRCKEVFLMSRFEHYSNFEIAKKLGINKRTVENYLTNALHSIRVNLDNILSVLMICILLRIL